jgi:hypothetical protein
MSGRSRLRPKVPRCSIRPAHTLPPEGNSARLHLIPSFASSPRMYSRICTPCCAHLTRTCRWMRSGTSAMMRFWPSSGFSEAAFARFSLRPRLGFLRLERTTLAAFQRVPREPVVVGRHVRRLRGEGPRGRVRFHQGPSDNCPATVDISVQISECTCVRKLFRRHRRGRVASERYLGELLGGVTRRTR